MQYYSCRYMGTDDQVKQVAMSLLKFELDELQNEFNEGKMVGRKERLYYDRKKNLERQMSNGIETRMQYTASRICQKFSLNATQYIGFRRKFPAIVYYQDALDRMLEKQLRGEGGVRSGRDLEKKIDLYKSKIEAIQNHDGIWNEEATWVKCAPEIEIGQDWDEIHPFTKTCDKCDGIGFTTVIQSIRN